MKRLIGDTIARLAHGKYINKDNADCVTDPITRSFLRHHHRDLEALGDYLLEYYRRLIEERQMTGKAALGDFPFLWQTDFNFPWSGGWLNNQEGKTEERDLLVVIPGRDRGRAVVMADHYDTAYMEDRYEKAAAGWCPAGRGRGRRQSLSHCRHDARRADIPRPQPAPESWDATCGWCTLPARSFLRIAWCRHLAQCIVEGALKIRRKGSRRLDLSKVRIQGVFVSDMIAHNNDNDPDVFQISPRCKCGIFTGSHRCAPGQRDLECQLPVWNRRSQPPRL